MARKINGPFGDVSIHTIGQMGSTTTNNDVFFNLIHSEMNLYAHEYSSTRSAQLVERLKTKNQEQPIINQSGDETQNLIRLLTTWDHPGFNNATTDHMPAPGHIIILTNQGNLNFLRIKATVL